MGHAEKKWSMPFVAAFDVLGYSFDVTGERDSGCREISPERHGKPVTFRIHLSGQRCASQDHVRACGKPCLWYSAERKGSISRVTKVRLWEKKIVR